MSEPFDLATAWENQKREIKAKDAEISELKNRVKNLLDAAASGSRAELSNIFADAEIARLKASIAETVKAAVAQMAEELAIVRRQNAQFAALADAQSDALAKFRVQLYGRRSE